MIRLSKIKLAGFVTHILAHVKRDRKSFSSYYITAATWYFFFRSSHAWAVILAWNKLVCTSLIYVQYVCFDTLTSNSFVTQTFWIEHHQRMKLLMYKNNFIINTTIHTYNGQNNFENTLRTCKRHFAVGFSLILLFWNIILKFTVACWNAIAVAKHTNTEIVNNNS